MFDSLFATSTNYASVFLMVALALLSGVIAAFLLSRKVRSGKEFFLTVALLPPVVATAFFFLNVMIKKDAATAIGSLAAVMVGMGLIRFRSAQGRADEMLSLFVAVVLGVVNGLGYCVYALIFSVVVPALYLLFAALPLFKNRRLSAEKLLKITIPESLEYSDAFDATFKHFLKEVEPVGVKTTGMGSMFRLSYRIVMKNPAEEKEMIDELRIKNGNLEISILPYIADSKEL